MKKEKRYNVMIGSGEDAIIIKVPKNKKVFTSGGSRVTAGLTKEEQQKIFADKFDDAFYSKPVAFTKKLIRKKKSK